MSGDVILVGASVRSLAESAIRDGLTPFCIDMFGDADLEQRLSSAFKDSSERLVRISSFADVPEAVHRIPTFIPIIITGGLENHPDILQQIANPSRICGTTSETNKLVRNPDVFFRRLRMAGFHVPDWGVPRINRDAVCPTVFKSISSAGGMSVSRLCPIRDNQEHDREPHFYEQEFVEGIAASATFLVSSMDSLSFATLLGVSLLLCGEHHLNAPSFQFCGNAGPVHPCQALQAELMAMGNTIAAEWPIRGLFGVDFIVKDGRPIPIEINLRPTAAHELYELARPELPGHVAFQLTPELYCAADKPKTNRQKESWIRMVVYSDTTVHIDQKTESKLLQRSRFAGDSARYGYWLADIPCSGTILKPGMPLCSIYLQLSKALQNMEKNSEFFAAIPCERPINATGILQEIQGRIAVLESDCEIVAS